MAVRAHDFTLGDLRQEGIAGHRQHARYAPLLTLPRQVIEVERGGMLPVSAICAPIRQLEFSNELKVSRYALRGDPLTARRSRRDLSRGKFGKALRDAELPPLEARQGLTLVLHHDSNRGAMPPDEAIRCGGPFVQSIETRRRAHSDRGRGRRERTLAAREMTGR